MSHNIRGFGRPADGHLEVDGFCYESLPINVDSGVGLDSYSSHSGEQLAANLDRLQLSPQHVQHPRQNQNVSISLLQTAPIATPEFNRFFLQNDEGDTPLHLSIMKSDHELSLRLIYDAEDPEFLNIQNYHYNLTPLHLAVITQQPDIVRELVVHGASLRKQDQDGNTPMHLACRMGSMDCLRQLTTRLSEQERQTLLQKSRHNPSYVTEFIRSSQDFSVKNYEGESCLHITLSSLSQPIQSRLNIIMYLILSLAVDINIQEGKCGYTILHQAIKMNELDIVKFLLYQPSIDVNRCCYNGSTPLSLAKCQQQHDIINQLINLGAIDRLSGDLDCNSESDEDQMDGFDDLMI